MKVGMLPIFTAVPGYKEMFNKSLTKDNNPTHLQCTNANKDKLYLFLRKHVLDIIALNGTFH